MRVTVQVCHGCAELLNLRLAIAKFAWSSGDTCHVITTRAPNLCLQPTRLTSAVTYGSRRCSTSAAPIVPFSVIGGRLKLGVSLSV